MTKTTYIDFYILYTLGIDTYISKYKLLYTILVPQSSRSVRVCVVASSRATLLQLRRFYYYSFY